MYQLPYFFIKKLDLPGALAAEKRNASISTAKLAVLLKEFGKLLKQGIYKPSENNW